jgi:hypothetical protein
MWTCTDCRWARARRTGACASAGASSKPSWPGRGVVAEGLVGRRWLGRWRLFRYEVRRWRNGIIPDIAEAVASPQRLRTDPDRIRLLLDLVPAFPAATWGLDERHTGDMWDSNTLIAWLLARSGHSVDEITPPPHGRAPGWTAGLVAARRDAPHLVGGGAR